MALLKFRIKNPVTAFYINLCLVISLVIIAIYIGVYLRNNSQLIESVKQQASSYFDLIVRVRSWNAQHGGVYVEKKAGLETNPYLREMGIEADIQAGDRVFTLRNPALMTREISSILSERNGTRFHITSQQLVNPDNAPDQFEIRAMKSFENGARDFWEIDENQPSRFRYMAPLLVEQSCLKCHYKFGYKVGDVRGGISVSIPYQAIEKQMLFNRYAILTLCLLTLIVFFVYAYMMHRHLIGKIDEAQQNLRDISITDELTGLKNRRFLMSRLQEEFARSRRHGSLLGILMIDIDHFKAVNDTCGHPFGDRVLKNVAGVISTLIRDYDVAGRYGGEEFLVIVAESSHEGLAVLAERMRQDIEKLVTEDQLTSIRVTISIGIALLADDDNIETILKKADLALYQAKKEGRNRVCCS
jgi:diguanylate cyclase (GGDEF)-like protein